MCTKQGANLPGAIFHYADHDQKWLRFGFTARQAGAGFFVLWLSR